MHPAEQRRAPRYSTRIPLRLRLLAQPEEWEQITESVDVSADGLYFASDRPMKVGTEVEIYLEMPEEITGEPSCEWHCQGRVVHVRPYFLPFGKSGVGVQFDRREVCRAAPPISDPSPRKQGRNESAV
jgi:hypothetical protein